MVNSNEIAFVLRAKNRIKILNALYGKELVSKQIEKITSMYKSHVSRTLTELQSKELIFCTNPTDRNFKFYKLTNKGRTVLKKIKNITSN